MATIRKLPNGRFRAGKRGKLAKSNAHNLWERFKAHEASVLLFAKEPHVAFTNNRAEQDLRMAKVKQTASGCFRAEEYVHAYYRISSYLQTRANRGIIRSSRFKWLWQAVLKLQGTSSYEVSSIVHSDNQQTDAVYPYLVYSHLKS